MSLELIGLGVIVVVTIVLLATLLPMFFSQSYAFKDKRVFITGASQGLGRATAIELAKKGAHVILLARNEAELKAAVAEATGVRISSTQKIDYVVCDVTKKDQIAQCMKAAIDKAGGIPDVLIPCAGSSLPKLFLDATLDDFETQIRLNYLGTVYFVHEGVRLMRDNKVKGKVVFVSSTMALTAFPGYGPYTPSKWAIRGLSDTLESELRLYDISVHHIYPPGMDTPGFKQENLIKPAITKEIEGAADVFTPQQVAVMLVKGVETGQYHITCDLITWLFRIIGGGTSRRPNVLFEMFLLPLLSLVMVVVLWTTDGVVSKAKKKKAD